MRIFLILDLRIYIRRLENKTIKEVRNRAMEEIHLRLNYGCANWADFARYRWSMLCMLYERNGDIVKNARGGKGGRESSM